jgi:hypothetical protein
MHIGFLLKIQKERGHWEDLDIVNLGEIGWGGLDWIHLAHDRD